MKVKFTSLLLILFMLFGQYALLSCDEQIDYTLNENGDMNSSEREKLAKKLVKEYCAENGIDEKYKLYMADVYYIEDELGYMYSFNTEGSYTADTSSDISVVISSDGSNHFFVN